MLVMPTKEELVDFKPDFVIYNAGKFPCNRCCFFGMRSNLTQMVCVEMLTANRGKTKKFGNPRRIVEEIDSK